MKDDPVQQGLLFAACMIMIVAGTIAMWIGFGIPLPGHPHGMG